MSNGSQPRLDGAQQKRLLINIVSEPVAALAGAGADANELPLHKADKRIPAAAAADVETAG